MPPEKASKEHSGNVLFFHGFVAELVEIVTDRNEKNLQSDGIEPSAHDSPVPSVIFHNAKCTFCLNRTVHSQQCAMDTVQIIQHLPVHRGQLLVDSHHSVLRRLFAFGCIGAAAAILAFKYFLLPSVFVSLYVLSITDMLTLQLSSSFRSEQYPLSANANSTVFSISTGLYLFRPVMYSGTFFKYLLKSIPSMNRSNANTGSDIERKSERNTGICPCRGV